MNGINEKVELEETNIVVVPGLLDSSFTYKIAEKAIKIDKRKLIQFAFHSEDKSDLEKKFSDEIDTLADFCNKQDSYEIFTFSHGFTVTGFCYKEKLIQPKRIVAVSPIISREDWLDIKNSIIPSFGPYLKDPLIKTSKVDFSSDTRRFLNGTVFNIPVVLIHGNRDEYFYNSEGQKIGQNNIESIIQPNIKIEIIEKMGHYPLEITTYKQVIKHISQIYSK